MQNFDVYCATGTFTGRKNGRDHRLALTYGDQIHCDGYEVMVFEDWYDHLDTIIQDYRSHDIRSPVVHADKRVGDLICGDSTTSAAFAEAVELWKVNCHFAAAIGARRVVTHPWGYPGSDSYLELVYERCGRLLDIAKTYGVDMVAENVICTHGSPIAHIEELVGIYPDMGVTIDTRHMQFHAELVKTCASPVWRSGNVRHIHISDYAGGYKDWDRLRVLPGPGEGDVDYRVFFQHLHDIAYEGTMTMESPSIPQEQGVDVERLNDRLAFIRDGLHQNNT